MRTKRIEIGMLHIIKKGKGDEVRGLNIRKSEIMSASICTFVKKKK